MDVTPPLDDSAVRWSGAPGGRPVVVLLHGHGADENDLFGIAPLLPDAFAYAAVRAPLDMPWPQPGYSWYPIEGLESRDPARTTEAARRFLDWAGAALDETTRVGLLGFSQGGAVALQALRLAPERFAFAVNLSGYVTPGALEGDAALADRRPAVFWGRGTHDTVIPDALVAHTVEWLPRHADLVGRVYPGLGHAVSPTEIEDLRTFLEKQAG
ncbi:alpha/beta hydrolase-fold protein [Microbacterium betulae]|uniref:Alpha/beta hydrolase-fold protein n=1 Tax=Microbacterium betulae TaxID=2981139 RepID=A0AA97I6B3_9MICO|nr:alpha/beta fold hydrolase [Microbacterium sp. AB]WOF22442.1 alpha/beta hydrolase-fold protein [Microbacterium sp. AB]